MTSTSFLRFIAIALLAFFFAGCATSTKPTTRPVAIAPTTAPTLPPVITAGPYLQAPAQDGVTIVWMTNRNCVSHVEYAESPNGELKTAFSSHDGLLDANTTLHRVRLTGLKPGTAYQYRVISREIIDRQAYKVVFGLTVRSEERAFTTLDPQKPHFSFVVLNDRHEKLPALRKALSSIKWDGVDLVFYNGDMYNYAQSEGQMIRSVVKPSVAAFASTIPFILIRGNHDTRGAAAPSLKTYFPQKDDRYYYSFDHGGVHFIVLDSGEDKRDQDVEYFGLVDFDHYLAEETEWLKREVQSPAFRRARFRVALVHIPPTAAHDPKFIRGAWMLENWVPLLNSAKLDLMLCGHEHRYAELPPKLPDRSFPIIVNNINTVLRVDVSPQRLELTTSNDDGTLKSTPPAVEAR